MRHRITAFGVACAFLVCCILMVGLMAFSGCATMNKLLGVKDYYTIEMYVQGRTVPTHFPNEIKNFKFEDARFMLIFNDYSHAALRYWIEDPVLFCDHWMEAYTGKDIMLIIWDEHGTFVKGWIYNDKGIPVKAYEETVIDLLHEIIGQEEVKGDSVWLNELEKQSEDAAKETDDIWKYLAKSIAEFQILVLDLNRELVGQ